MTYDGPDNPAKPHQSIKVSKRKEFPFAQDIISREKSLLQI